MRIQQVASARVIAVLGAVCAGAFAIGACTPLAPSPPAAPTTRPAVTTTTTTRLASPYTLLWSDEFSGGAVDTGRWKPYYNDYGSANSELQCHTPANAAVTAGALHITARKQTVTCPTGGQKDYTSAFLGSRDTGNYYPLYGRYEIRARLPHGQGLWPAFWLRHRNGSSTGEVDIMELFHSEEPGKARQSVHFPNSLGFNVASKAFTFEQPVPGGGTWHRFAVVITPAGDNAIKFTFSIDGNTTYSYTNPDVSSWVNTVSQDHAWDIAVNMSVGGDWIGNPDTELGYFPNVNRCSLTGKAPPGGLASNCPTTGLNFAKLPAAMDVDWVRVSVKA